MWNFYHNAGFDVDIVNGANVSVNFLQNRLTEYGVLFINGHGQQGTTNYWIQTGEKDSLDSVLNKYYSEWVSEDIALGKTYKKYLDEVYENTQTAEIWVSNNFFKRAYSNNKLPQSIVYFGNCNAMRNVNSMANTLSLCGAGAVIGWSYSNGATYALIEALELSTYLVGGKNIIESFSMLPESSKVQKFVKLYFGVNGQSHVDTYYSYLRYYPESGGYMRLYEPSIPEDGVLINGVVWATRNVDAPGTFAASPESAGMFYQWNRKIGWSSTDPLINSEGGTIWDFTTPPGNEWENVNDPSPAG